MQSTKVNWTDVIVQHNVKGIYSCWCSFLFHYNYMRMSRPVYDIITQWICVEGSINTTRAQNKRTKTKDVELHPFSHSLWSILVCVSKENLSSGISFRHKFEYYLLYLILIRDFALFIIINFGNEWYGTDFNLSLMIELVLFAFRDLVLALRINILFGHKHWSSYTIPKHMCN